MPVTATLRAVTMCSFQICLSSECLTQMCMGREVVKHTIGIGMPMMRKSMRTSDSVKAFSKARISVIPPLLAPKHVSGSSHH